MATTMTMINYNGSDGEQVKNDDRVQAMTAAGMQTDNRRQLYDGDDAI